MADITCAELKQRIQNKEELNIIDVREPWEYAEANIGVPNIPLGLLPHRLAEIEKYKNEELIIHCRSGKRSDSAMKFLQQQGYTNVRNLLGGIVEYLETEV